MEGSRDCGQESKGSGVRKGQRKGFAGSLGDSTTLRPNRTIAFENKVPDTQDSPSSGEPIYLMVILGKGICGSIGIPTYNVDSRMIGKGCHPPQLSTTAVRRKPDSAVDRNCSIRASTEGSTRKRRARAERYDSDNEVRCGPTDLRPNERTAAHINNLSLCLSMIAEITLQ